MTPLRVRGKCFQSLQSFLQRRRLLIPGGEFFCDLAETLVDVLEHGKTLKCRAKPTAKNGWMAA